MISMKITRSQEAKSRTQQERFCEMTSTQIDHRTSILHLLHDDGNRSNADRDAAIVEYQKSWT